MKLGPIFQSDPIQQPEKRNISFATQKLNILFPLTLKKVITPANTIIFTHIPKTGGTNLRFITEALSKIRLDFTSTRFAVPRIQNYSPNIIYDNWIGGLESAENELKVDPYYCDKTNFISGHFPFGLHELIKNDAKYIVLIRHPIERAISSTNFDYQRGYVSDEKSQEYLFESEIDNPQTRIIAGRAFTSGECTEEILEIAKKNIENYFLLVGITEDTSTFIQVLMVIQNWETFALVRSQVTGKKIITEPSSEIIQKLEAKHSYDMRLYDWVKIRWNEWKKENISANISPLHAEQKIICITSDYARSRNPAILSVEEIEEYNKQLSENLIEISQTHTQPIIVSDFNTPVFIPYCETMSESKSEQPITTEQPLTFQNLKNN